MLFDQLLHQMEQRVDHYLRSHDADVVLGEEAVEAARELFQAARPANIEQPTPDEDQRMALAMYGVGRLCLARHQALPAGPEGLSELARAIFNLAPWVHDPDLIPEGLHGLLGATADAGSQAELAAVLLEQSRNTIDPALLHAGIWLLTTSLATTPREHPSQAGWWANLGLAYRLRFERGGVLADLDHAIEAGNQVVAATLDDDRNRASQLSYLCDAYLSRFEHRGELADLDHAIEAGNQAVAATPDDDSNQAGRLANLALAYRRRSAHGEVPTDLDHAIKVGKRAVAAASSDDPNRAGVVANLGVAYHSRFEHGGELADLDHAIEAGEQAVAGTPANHPDLAGRLSNVSNFYHLRFRHGGLSADLDHAIDAVEQAIAATPDDQPDRVVRLSNLGSAYHSRFEHGGVPADLDRAIDAGEQAVAAASHNHPDWAGFLSNLGATYRSRFEHRGEPADLDTAIEVGEQAVAAAHDNDRNRASKLSNLGIAYRSRFEHRGELADLDRAIEVGEQAVAAASHNHPDRAGFLSNLGLAYQSRFERGGVSADLDHAIKAGEEAVIATPHDRPERGGILTNVSNVYRMRFERGGELADLDHAIEAGEQAVSATPDDHSDLAGRLSNVSNAYRMRFRHGEVSADVDQAIMIGEQAVAASPDNHPERAGFLTNLGLAYQMRFERDGVSADIDQAIMIGEQAVAATPDGHPDLTGRLSNLGRAYLMRSDVDGRRIGREALRALAGQVAAAGPASPVDRVRAGQIVGSLAHAEGEHHIAVELLDAAVSGLPSVAPREAGLADQEHRLGGYLGLVGEAVAAHCAIGDHAGAVETAELGRGILLAAQLDSRSDLTDLEYAHPMLAAEFRAVRDQLNARQTARTAPGQLGSDPIGEIEHRKRLWAKYDRLCARIRQHAGFARFLLPPRLADLQLATTGGAVILVNTGRRRGDAIILTNENAPVHVPLPDAVLEVSSYAEALIRAVREDNVVGILRRQRVVPEILSWLWNAVVGPVLKALPPTVEETSTPRRVWWVPTGLLGLFPLHAAGHPEQPGALDAVISSYTPTLRTLVYARNRPPATIRRQLTVALRRTPGLPDLPGTVAEATTLHTQHPDTPLLLDEEATTSRVLDALPDATWAHFACHASADLTAPSQGGFALHDGILALPQISQMRLSHAELAYLSACSTADRGWRLADESLHLASAFQLAGFRHVIASLWPLNDHVAATAAAAVYRHLPDTPNADHAATALHHVARELRADYPGRPDLWTALIHNGP
ncbi:CHAT domain-containing protein [Amycolatopsis sp. WAC 04169]|uniref:CHAT domain-containing protein n=1 Tax=Amycolatopsis sp. WAC 04169 TaxID=2203197 RepID=UPI0013152061|nr:CHAT domain-containing protein [Amycolatopsis sp. WAC 04169]